MYSRSKISIFKSNKDTKIGKIYPLNLIVFCNLSIIGLHLFLIN